MANTKSARKQIRVAQRKQLYNKGPRHLVKTRISKTEKLIAAGDLEAAKKEAVEAISTLDKAAKKGIVHPNNAARRKARLVKKLNAAQALAPPAPESKATG